MMMMIMIIINTNGKYLEGVRKWKDNIKVDYKHVRVESVARALHSKC
jgi:hypothetical protein